MDVRTYQHYIDLGLSVVGCDDNKNAVISWTAFQSSLPTEKDVDEFLRRKASKMAVVCGEVSGNLVCIDFDIKNHPTPDLLWQEFWEMLVDYYAGDPSSLVLVQTPSGGYHLWFKCESVSTNKKLAGRPTTDEERALAPKVKKVYYIETRGQGGYAVVPPSAGYKFIQGSFEKIPFLDTDRFEEILTMCRSFNTIEEETIEHRPKNVSPHIYKDTPWDAYNADTTDPHIDLLLEAGWSKVQTVGTRTHFRRPGSENKWSANWCSDKRLFYVFTINSDFEPDTAYTPFSILKTLAFNGDKSETIKHLRQNGYGKAWEDHENALIQSIAIELDKGKMFEDIIAQFYQIKEKPEAEQKKIMAAATTINNVKKGCFWKQGKRGQLILDRNSLLEFLKNTSEGLGKNWRLLLLVDSVNSNAYRMCIINEESRIIKQVDFKSIKEWMLKWINDFDFSDYDVRPSDVKNLLLDLPDASLKNILDYITVTPIKELNFLRDQKNKSYFFFLNNVVVVTPEQVLLHAYDYFPEGTYIWEERIIPFNFSDISIKNNRVWNSYVFQFLRRLAGIPKQYDNLNFEELAKIEMKHVNNIYAFLTCYGYLSTNYKDPDQPYAILLAEDTADDGEGGGTGKGLFAKCIAKIRSTCVIDGKNWSPDKPFAFQRVDLNTDIMAIEDIEPYFAFRKMYNLITEGIEIEKKNKDSFQLDYEFSPKIILSTNYEALDRTVHYLRRFKKLLLHRYFNIDRTPRSEYGNKNFFYDWNEDEWNDFYAFSFLCIQFYYVNGVQVSEETDNSVEKAIKLKAGSCGDDFYNYCVDKIENVKELNFKYEKKEFWRDFLEENDLTARDLSMKHFTASVSFFCFKKGISVEQSRDNNINPYDGRKGVVRLVFDKTKPFENTQEQEVFDIESDLPF